MGGVGELRLDGYGLRPVRVHREANDCTGKPSPSRIGRPRRFRSRPEISVETKLNGVDVLPVRPEARFGLPIEPPSE